MNLTQDEKKDLINILVAIYGSDFSRINPTAQTLELTEKMLIEINKCNKRIQTLLKSLPCAIIKRGFLYRCLRSTANIVLKEPQAFRGCINISRNLYKHPIYISGL